jgi:hypothetical protein
MSVRSPSGHGRARGVLFRWEVMKLVLDEALGERLDFAADEVRQRLLVRSFNAQEFVVALESE